MALNEDLVVLLEPVVDGVPRERDVAGDVGAGVDGMRMVPHGVVDATVTVDDAHGTKASSGAEAASDAANASMAAATAVGEVAMRSPGQALMISRWVSGQRCRMDRTSGSLISDSPAPE